MSNLEYWTNSRRMREGHSPKVSLEIDQEPVFGELGDYYIAPDNGNDSFNYFLWEDCKRTLRIGVIKLLNDALKCILLWGQWDGMELAVRY